MFVSSFYCLSQFLLPFFFKNNLIIQRKIKKIERNRYQIPPIFIFQKLHNLNCLPGLLRNGPRKRQLYFPILRIILNKSLHFSGSELCLGLELLRFAVAPDADRLLPAVAVVSGRLRGRLTRTLQSKKVERIVEFKRRFLRWVLSNISV